MYTCIYIYIMYNYKYICMYHVMCVCVCVCVCVCIPAVSVDSFSKLPSLCVAALCFVHSVSFPHSPDIHWL